MKALTGVFALLVLIATVLSIRSEAEPLIGSDEEYICVFVHRADATAAGIRCAGTDLNKIAIQR